MSATKTFRTWLPEHGETEATGEDIEVQSYEDAGDAAEDRHEDFDRDSEVTHRLTVHVRDGDRVRVFVSSADYTVNYYASETKSSREGTADAR